MLEGTGELPLLRLTLKQIDFCQEIDVRLPATVNKFGDSLRVEVEACIEYLEYVS